MIKKMLISAQDSVELRVALVENGRMEAFYVETAAREQSRGNIYKGTVANVEPSLQAAFIDYGADRHGFLQINDLDPTLFPARTPDKEHYAIQELLKRGQELLVQVVKEQTGGKGASLTTYLSIPGQSLVLTRGRHLAGVSRKIESEAERKRLKDILGEFSLPPHMGVIARTASEGRSKRDLQANYRLLIRLWEDIDKRGQKIKAPALLHREEELAVRTVRDLFTVEVDEILVDNQEVFNRLQEFLALVNPRRQKVLRLYKEEKPIFHKYNVEQQLESVYQPRVLLLGGGSIVIQPTEALVSVDVNSGKAIKGKEIEETALMVNQEAAVEIARQLRLRDLGGLVVIDFIDMRDRQHQNQILKVFKEELKKDKAKVTLGRLSRFGLLELSRQRFRPPIDFGDTQYCPYCQGRGLVRTLEAVARSILRQLELRIQDAQGSLKVSLSPEMTDYLLNNKRAALAQMEQSRGVCLDIKAKAGLAWEEMRTESGGQPWLLPTVSEAEPTFKESSNKTEIFPEQAAAMSEKEPPKAEDRAVDMPQKQQRRSANRKKTGENNISSVQPKTTEEPVMPQSEPEVKQPLEGTVKAALNSGAAPAKKPRRRRSASPKNKPAAVKEGAQISENNASSESSALSSALDRPLDAESSPTESLSAADASPRKRSRRRRSGSARRRAKKAMETGEMENSSA